VSPERTPVPAQRHFVDATTAIILDWLKSRREPSGRIKHFTLDELFAAADLERRRYGQPMGNVTSRLDLACYFAGLPPICLAGERFRRAWLSRDDDESWPIDSMQRAAYGHSWTDKEFEAIQSEVRKLPGLARNLLNRFSDEENKRHRAWADSM
jgi:hypothetical protein